MSYNRTPIYFEAVLVSGVSCMGLVRPKVSDVSAGRTAACRLTRKCAVITPIPMPVPTIAPVGPPKTAPVAAPAPPAIPYCAARVLGLSRVWIVPSALTFVPVECAVMLGTALM
jgi:hypothetical protein